MPALFLVITGFNLLCLLLTAALGYSYGGSLVTQWHPLAGIVSTMVCVGVHCIVFTYFIATAKWVQHAVLTKRLDAQLVTPTRSFKMQAFPAALLAMASVFAAAILGAARVNYDIPPLWHHAAAWIAIAINALVAVIEYRAIGRNGALVDTVLAAIHFSAPSK
jgi:hypothetical protein